MLAFLSNVFPVIGCKDHSVEEVFIYTVNDYHTLGMFHPREHRGTKRRTLLDTGQPGVFRTEDAGETGCLIFFRINARLSHRQ